MNVLSYLDAIVQAYKDALQQGRERESQQAQRTAAGKKLANLGVQASGITQAAQAIPYMNYAASMFPQSTLTGVTGGAVAPSTFSATTAPTVGPLVSAAVPTAAVPAANAAAGAGMAATAGGETAAAGAGGATAGSQAGSALSSTGIGAIIGAGLAIGSSSPGQFLFPAKRFMYNTTLPIYNISGGGFADKLLGRFSPRNSLDWIFGNPNEQLEEYKRQQTRAKALMAVNRLSSINDKVQAWGNPEEVNNNGE